VRASEKNINVAVAYPSELPRHFQGDALRIRQVVTNLAGNAVKFTDRGSISIAVEGQAAGESSAQVRIQVTDSGIGIPREKLAFVFDRFTQIDSSSTRRYGGTGLGLAIAKQLVELMGGRIRARSEVGCGSTFTVELTLPIAVTQTLKPAVAAPPPVETAPPRKPKVLLAEDNPINQRVATRMLAKLGVVTEVAVNGMEAVEMSRRQPYDLIFMDCHMPEMDGYEATRAIRQDGGRRVPIVAMTAEAMTGCRDECLAAGMDDYIAKPINPAVVSEALQKWVPLEPAVL